MPLTQRHRDQRATTERNVLAWLTTSPPGLSVRELARMPAMRVGASAIRHALDRLIASGKVRRVESRRFRERIDDSGPIQVKCARYYLLTAAARDEERSNGN